MNNPRHHKQKRGLAALIAAFLGEPGPEPGPATDPVQLAVSVILMEAASADELFSDTDRRNIAAILQRRFNLSVAEVDRLMEIARRERRHNPDLWRFTHEINRRCSKARKLEIMETVWRIILADGILERHEDQLAHKLARLLNLDHPELIRAKLKAK